jgi:hypothetical protein
MTSYEYKLIVEEMHDFCKEIGCSGLSKSCNESPYNCAIVQKIFKIPSIALSELNRRIDLEICNDTDR